MARIVIGWELGSSPELLYDLRDIGRALGPRGHRVTYSVADPVALAMLFEPDENPEILAAPIPSVKPELLVKAAREGGFIDKLAVQGFATIDSLKALAQTWQRSVERDRADVVLAIGAPVLALAVRGRCPLFVLGSAESMPPAEASRLPRVVANIAPALTDDKLLANTAAVINAIGSRAVARSADLVAGDATLVYGLGQLDPYLSMRSAQSAPLRPLPHLAPPAGTSALVAVLDANHPFIETLIIALTDLGKVPIDVYLRGGTRPMRTYLSQTAGITVHDRVEGALQRLGDASYILHHGTPMVAEAALSCGRPQVILPFIHEQGLLASFLERSGGSQTLTTPMPAPDLADYLIRHFRDLNLVQQAQLAAQNLAAVSFPDTMAAIVDVTEKLAQASSPAEVGV